MEEVVYTSDKSILGIKKREALKAEGLTDDQITVEDDEIIETEDGFISYRIEHELPYITHYLVYPSHRENPLAWLDLFDKFRSHIFALGHQVFLAEVIPGKERFRQFIKFYKGRLYATIDGREYYTLPVISRRTPCLNSSKP